MANGKDYNMDVGTMLDSSDDVFLLDAVHRLTHHRFVAVLDQANKFPSTQSLELAFEQAEHSLDCVVVWAVSYIVNPAEVELSHVLLRLLAGVAAQLIHKETELVVAVRSTEFSEVLLELHDVD